MLTDDPWTWSVNDLIAELCHSTAVYQAANCAVNNISDAAALEDELRDQEITGAKFLSALDSNTLRTQLGIQNEGQRLALMSAIELLRSRSAGYKHHTTIAGVQTLLISNESVPNSTLPTSNISELSGRKRQKLTHITTTSLPANASPPRPTYDLWVKDLEKQVIDGSGEFDYLLRWQAEDRQGAVPNKPTKDAALIDNEQLTDDEESVEDEDQAAEAEREEVEVHVASEPARLDPQRTQNAPQGKGEAPNRPKLTSDEIVDIVNEQIEHFTNSWTPEKEAQKGERIDPIALWEEAEAAGTRHQFVDVCKRDGVYYRLRLDNFCEAILKDPGSSAEKIRLQCRNLEETTDLIEFSDYLLGIYSLAPVDDYDDEDEDEDEAISNGLDGTDHGLDRARQEHGLPTRPIQPPVEVIDLGSPSDPSDDEQDGMIVDSSPPPNLTSSPHRFHTPDSVPTDTVEPTASAPRPPPTTRTATTHSLAHLGDEPENASIASARRWRWPDLISTQDRKRIVTKALLELPASSRETIRARLRTVGKADLVREIPACIHMLARNETKLHGVLPRDMPKIVTFTKLFLCWWLGDNYFRVEPLKWQLDELQRCLADGSPDPGTFCDFLDTVMRTTFSLDALRHPELPSQREIIEISDDDEEEEEEDRGRVPAATQRKEAIVID
jgi:hypothetical protein